MPSMAHEILVDLFKNRPSLAAEILANWENALGSFVKVMPKDYRRALLEMQAERQTVRTEAAE